MRTRRMQTRKPIWWRPLVGLTALMLAVTACDEDGATGPSGSVDPEASAASMDDVVASMEGNEAMQSFNASGPLFGAVFGGPTVSAAELDAAPLLSRGLKRATLHALAVTSVGPTAHLAGVIPPEIMGTTYEYDPEQEKYVASDRPGAPENGVRFILYAINPVTKKPIVDTEVGWVDFIDESDATANRLRTLVVSDEATHVDFVVSCGFVTGGIEVTGEGFITDGTTQVDLDLSLGFSQTDGISFDYQVDVPSKNLEVDLEMSGVAPEGDDDTFTAHYVFRRGSNEIDFSLSAEDGALDGTVTFNGAVAAVISGTLEDPVVTDAEGNELGPEGRKALHDLLRGAGKGIDNLSGLLGPAFEICFLAN